MKDSETQNFEKAWSDAFQHAELAPSDKVWAGVEHGLDVSETVIMKKRVLFYQRLAAASILFAFLLGSLSLWYINGINKVELSENNPAVKTERLNELENQTVKPPDITKIEAQQGIIIEKQSAGNDLGKGLKGNGTLGNSDLENQLSAESSSQSTIILIESKYDGKEFLSLLSSINIPELKLKGEVKDVEIVRILPAMPSSFMSDSKSDKSSKENLWASVGASMGNYTPSSDFGSLVSPSSYSYKTSSVSYSTASSSSSSKGSIFSVGMNMGTRISKRWVLQGGISYLTQSIGYTSNLAFVTANNEMIAAVADVANLQSNSSVSVTNPYQINSINEFVNIPVQTGYMLVDRKFGLQLNSGIATSLFFQNTLSDKSGQLSSFTSGAGSDSPYRTVSWAGLVGTELSYKLGQQYRLSLVPGVTYYLNSIQKSGSTQTNPLIWDLGFKFKYIIK
jgi:hypothetical protein